MVSLKRFWTKLSLGIFEVGAEWGPGEVREKVNTRLSHQTFNDRALEELERFARKRIEHARIEEDSAESTMAEAVVGWVEEQRRRKRRSRE